MMRALDRAYLEEVSILNAQIRQRLANISDKQESFHRQLPRMIEVSGTLYELMGYRCQHGQEQGNCPICSQTEYPIDDDFGQQMHAMGMLRTNLEQALALLRRYMVFEEGTSLDGWEHDVRMFLSQRHFPEEL